MMTTATAVGALFSWLPINFNSNRPDQLLKMISDLNISVHTAKDEATEQPFMVAKLICDIAFHICH